MINFCNKICSCLKLTNAKTEIRESILPKKESNTKIKNLNSQLDSEKVAVVFKNQDFNLKGSINVKHATFYDFRKIACIGRGSYGTVYLVQYKENKKYYAMKVLKKDLIKKLKQSKNTKVEREILEKIQHPFIVSLYYAFQNSDGLFVVTEFLQGGDLFYHLRKHGIFTIDQIRFYAAEIVLGIMHLHTHSIIYRDLKLENVLLDKLGHIKLIDFGLSKICDDIYLDNSNVSDLQAKSFCGTNDYIAPEILLGKTYYSSVDWWSFGILLFEMAEGNPPFKLTLKDYVDELFNIKDKITFRSCHNEDLQNLIRSLLEINTEKRLGHGNNQTFIKNHSFFKGINWDKVINKQINPPFKPIINDLEDVSNFDSKFTKESVIENTNNEGFSLFPNPDIEHYDNFSFDTKN